jgi:hypothetical protein
VLNGKALAAADSILAQGMRGSLPTILSTRLRGPTMLTAQQSMSSVWVLPTAAMKSL